MNPSSGPSRSRRLALLVVAILAPVTWTRDALAVPTRAPLVGEIQSLTVDDPTDVYSGGTMVVSGKTVILPRNLLLDLPANRLTLQQLYAQAPANCLAVAQTGLAKADVCNASGAGALATIAANRMDSGNIIAGDVFIQKGIEMVTGVITYIDYTDGYFRLDGIVGDALTGTMVRINDPTARHTIQSGKGCAAGSQAVNCSPDPRFTLDPDNYVNVFSTGYPWCIPSTTLRGLSVDLGIGTTSAQAAPDGGGDALCPLSNRPPQPPLDPANPAPGPVAADSRRFAPLKLGDTITVEGNFERIKGPTDLAPVTFLSAHTTMVSVALRTQNVPSQPDYIFLDEVELDAPGFENQRVRSLIIGYSTLPSDVILWTIHRDPVNNAIHEFPWASTQGCEIASGLGNCALQGAFGNPNRDLIWKIRHDVDFLLGGAAQLDESPCAHIRKDPRLAPLNVCPNAAFSGLGTFAEEFAILSPVPREVQARTGHALANPGLITLDVSGKQATNGQYLFPFGLGLGGIAFAEFNEIDLNAMQKAFPFSGIPWMMDRRLSPGGCINGCEATPQPLDPFPYDFYDPRTQSSPPPPTGPWFDRNYTATTLSNASNRIFSYVDGALGKFNGDATLLAWPPAVPAAVPILPTAELGLLVCADGLPPTRTTTNLPPSAVADSATTLQGVPITVPALANDTDPENNPLLVTSVTQGGGGAVTTDGNTVTYVPALGFSGTDAFTYTIADGQGGVATASVFVTVLAAANTPPVATPDGATTDPGFPVTIEVLLNDTDAEANPLTVTGLGQPLNGVVSTDGNVVVYTPNAGFFGGVDTFTYTISDGQGGSASAFVSVTVRQLVNNVPVATPDSATTGTGVAVVIPVLANDTDADGDVLTVVATTPGLGGTTTTDGVTVTYTPNAGFAGGTDSFTYTVSDGRGGEATALVTMTVLPNAKPVAVADSVTMVEGGSRTIQVLANDTDANGDVLTVTAVSLPRFGRATRTTTSVTYTPNLGFNDVNNPPGVDTFTYTVSDGRGGTATATVTVTVTAVGGLAITLAEYRTQGAEWRVDGTSAVPGATITIRTGSNLTTGGLLGTAVADAAGLWTFRQRNSPIALPTSRTVSARSTTGATVVGFAVTVR